VGSLGRRGSRRSPRVAVLDELVFADRRGAQCAARRTARRSSRARRANRDRARCSEARAPNVGDGRGKALASAVMRDSYTCPHQSAARVLDLASWMARLGHHARWAVPHPRVVFARPGSSGQHERPTRRGTQRSPSQCAFLSR
jgi:hypothetical protein